MEKKHTVKRIKYQKIFFFVRHDIGEINQDKKVQKANVSSEEECHFESFRY